MTVERFAFLQSQKPNGTAFVIGESGLVPACGALAALIETARRKAEN